MINPVVWLHERLGGAGVLLWFVPAAVALVAPAAGVLLAAVLVAFGLPVLREYAEDAGEDIDRGVDG